MSSVKKACICSICTALCYVLPLAFHAIAAGSVLSPMHIPVLLCGLICGWQYGVFCGVAGPVISSLLSGMPSTVQLVYMIPELAAYGLFSGLFFKLLHTGHVYADLLLSMIPALILGRVAGGIARAIFFMASAQSYSVSLWVSAYIVDTLPGVMLQLVLIPSLVLVLMKAKLIPLRYPAGGTNKIK